VDAAEEPGNERYLMGFFFGVPSEDAPDCPRCGSTETGFVDADPMPDAPPEAFWPWYACTACGHAWQVES